MFSELQPERILETVSALEQRIGERFARSGLNGERRFALSIACAASPTWWTCIS